MIFCSAVGFLTKMTVFKLPQDAFDKLEAAAAAHPPKRVVNPSERWGLGFDLFDDNWPF